MVSQKGKPADKGLWLYLAPRMRKKTDCLKECRARQSQNICIKDTRALLESITKGISFRVKFRQLQFGPVDLVDELRLERIITDG